MTVQDSGKPASGDNVRTSAALRSFLAQHTAERVSVGDLRNVLGDRAYGVLILVFALPNVMPINVPGLSGLLGIPLILLSAQLAYGLPAPWFPGWISDRSVRRIEFEKAMLWGMSYLERVERVLRPRLPLLTRWTAERALGCLCLVLAIVITLPIPLGNTVPAIAVCILSLALIEKDGLAYAIGVAVSAIALTIVGGVVYALLKALLFFLFNVAA